MAEYFNDQDFDAGQPEESLENPYEDLQAISARIDRTLSIDRFQRSLFERSWFR
jgi:hypothetical protein